MTGTEETQREVIRHLWFIIQEDIELIPDGCPLCRKAQEIVRSTIHEQEEEQNGK